MKNKMLRILVCLCMCAAMMIMPVTSFAVDTEDVTEPEAVVNEELLENLADELQNDEEALTEPKKATKSGKDFTGNKAEDVTGSVYVVSDKDTPVNIQTVGNVTMTSRDDVYVSSFCYKENDGYVGTTAKLTAGDIAANSGEVIIQTELGLATLTANDIKDTTVVMCPAGGEVDLNCNNISTPGWYGVLVDHEDLWGTANIKAKDIIANGSDACAVWVAWEAGGTTTLTADNVKGSGFGLMFGGSFDEGGADQYNLDVLIDDTLYGGGKAIYFDYDERYLLHLILTR